MNKYKMVVIFSIVIFVLYHFTGCAKSEYKEVVSDTTSNFMSQAIEKVKNESRTDSADRHNFLNMVIVIR